MTVLVADRNTPMKDAELFAVPVAAGNKIFAGSIVCANVAGFAVKGQSSPQMTYLGRAEETVDNTAGANGAKTVLIRRGKAFKYANEATDLVTQASLGRCCYIFDDQTVAATSGATNLRPDCGIVVGVDADGVWVINAALDLRPITAALTYPAIAAAGNADLTIAYPGAALGDYVALGLPAAPPAGVIYNTFVSAVGVVTVRAFNITAAAITPPVANYTVAVQK